MTLKLKAVSLFAALVAAVGLPAADIELPKPETTGGMPLQDALRLRKTDRVFSEKPLPLQTVSNLLWSAVGINRPDGKRTSPTARNRQEITLYVCLPEGTFRYDPAANKLIQTSEKRAGDAPLMVIFVADMAKLPEHLCHVDCGFVSQNIYLYCASNQLATVVRGNFKMDDFKPLVELKGKEQILYVQAVGYPK